MTNNRKKKRKSDTNNDTTPNTDLPSAEKNKRQQIDKSKASTHPVTSPDIILPSAASSSTPQAGSSSSSTARVPTYATRQATGTSRKKKAEAIEIDPQELEPEEEFNTPDYVPQKGTAYSEPNIFFRTSEELSPPAIAVVKKMLERVDMSEEEEKSMTLLFNAYNNQEALKLNKDLSRAPKLQKRAYEMIESKAENASTALNSSLNVDDENYLQLKKSGNTVRLAYAEGRNSGTQDRHVSPISYLTHALIDGLQEGDNLNDARIKILSSIIKIKEILPANTPQEKEALENIFQQMFDAHRPGKEFRNVSVLKEDIMQLIKTIFSIYNNIPLLAMKDDKKTKRKAEGSDVRESLKILSVAEERLVYFNRIKIYGSANMISPEKSTRLRHNTVSSRTRSKLQKLITNQNLELTNEELNTINKVIYADFDYKKVKGKVLTPSKDLGNIKESDILPTLVARHLAIVFILCPLLQESHQNTIKDAFIKQISENHGLKPAEITRLHQYVNSILEKIGNFNDIEKQNADDYDMVDSTHAEICQEYEEYYAEAATDVPASSSSTSNVDDEEYDKDYTKYIDDFNELKNVYEKYRYAGDFIKMDKTISSMEKLNDDFLAFWDKEIEAEKEENENLNLNVGKNAAMETSQASAEESPPLTLDLTSKTSQTASSMSISDSLGLTASSRKSISNLIASSDNSYQSLLTQANVVSSREQSSGYANFEVLLKNKLSQVNELLKTDDLDIRHKIQLEGLKDKVEKFIQGLDRETEEKSTIYDNMEHLVEFCHEIKTDLDKIIKAIKTASPSLKDSVTISNGIFKPK